MPHGPCTHSDALTLANLRSRASPSPTSLVASPIPISSGRSPTAYSPFLLAGPATYCAPRSGAHDGMNRLGPGHEHRQPVQRNGRELLRGQGHQVLDTRYQAQYAQTGSSSPARTVPQSRQLHMRAPARPPLHRETQHHAVREHVPVHPSQAISRHSQHHPAYAPHPQPQLRYHAAVQPVQHVHWQSQQRAPAPRAAMPSRAPNVYVADADQWAALRARGYVLQGSMSAPSVVSMSASVGPELHPRTPELQYLERSTQPADVHRRSRTPSRPTYHRGQPSYEVHHSLRTSSHPVRTDFLQPSNTFMKSNATPVLRAPETAPKPSTQTGGPFRPAMRRQHTSTTLRSVSDGVQLRPDQVFLYQRPSKASYYRPEATYTTEQQPSMHAHAPVPVLARPRRVSSLGSTVSRTLQEEGTDQRHSADGAHWRRPSSIRSVSSSRPQTPCQVMGVQPDYPPSPAFSATTSIYPLETVRAHQRRASQGARSALGDSVPGFAALTAGSAAPATAAAPASAPQVGARSRRLARQETQMSAYSQQTYCEDYGQAMDRRPSTASSSGRHAAGGSSRPVIAHHGGTDTAFMPEMAFESNARLWQELEEALLGGDLPHSPLVEAMIAKQPSPTRCTEYEGSVYDFVGDAMEDTASTQRGKMDDRPLRPCLARRKSSTYRYKGHERHGRSIVNSALAATTPFLPPANTFGASPLHSPIPDLPTRSISDSSKQTGNNPVPVASHEDDNLVHLRSGLRAKTPGNELLEDQALHELKRQSAPSEVDHEDSGQDLSEEASNDHNSGEEATAEGANRTAEREKLAGRDLLIGQAGIAQGTITTLSGELISRSEVVCRSEMLTAEPRVLSKTVRRTTRIPAPKARPFAGKLYAERAQKRGAV